MPNKAPERVWVCPQYEEKAFHDFEFGGWPEYVRADILEAAQARIDENYRAYVHDMAALVDRLATARAEAYTECAKIADDWFARSGHGSPGDEIRAALEALEGGKSYGNG